MNNPIKNALDKINPDETTIKNIIQSQVRLFNNALTLICWGYVLIAFRLDIIGISFSTYTTWLGSILLMLGFWKLRSENRFMKVAFIGSLISLGMHMLSYWLVGLPKNNTLKTVNVLMIIFAALLALVEIWVTLKGFRDIALRFENKELASRLSYCFVMYLVLLLCVFACMVLPPLIIIFLPYGIFVLIYMPVTINTLRSHIPLGKRATTVKALNYRVLILLLIYIFVIVVGQIVILYRVNAPKPQSQIYSITHTQKTDAVREKLLGYGLPEHIINDLPESELLQYIDAYMGEFSSMPSHKLAANDGGELELYGFVAIMPKGKARRIFGYRWIEPPKHAFVDTFTIILNAQYHNPHFMMYNRAEERLMKLSLFEKDGKTYSQALLNKENEYSDFRQEHLKFRLYSDCQNQRGYIAMSVAVVRKDSPLNFNMFSHYTHQIKLWNYPHYNPEDNNTYLNNIFDASIRPNAFEEEQFWILSRYLPENYQGE